MRNPPFAGKLEGKAKEIEVSFEIVKHNGAMIASVEIVKHKGAMIASFEIVKHNGATEAIR